MAATPPAEQGNRVQNPRTPPGLRRPGRVENTAPLPRALSSEGAPQGHDPAAAEIGYWAPGGDLVLSYDSEAPYFDGIVRIGEFDGEMTAIERQSDDFSATIERAR